MNLEHNIEEKKHKETIPKNKKEMDFYSLDSGINVTVSAERFSRKESNENIDLEKGVFVLPGWGMDVNNDVVKNLTQEYAELFPGQTFSLSSRAIESNSENINILYEESKAMAEYIKKTGVKEITLSGHSQGADKAINIANILQEENPDLIIKGIVLMAPVGLYEHNKVDLVKQFTKDAVIKTPQDLVKNKSVIKPGLKTAVGLIKNMTREILKSNINYGKRLNREISEMTPINRGVENIKSPVVIISGTSDLVSNPESIISSEKIDEQKELFDKGTSDIREHFLKTELFKNSPYVKAIFPEKEGNHSLPFLRARSVANASLGIIERFNQNPNN